nr:hypothetical protein [Tanacetum cinerariifolium]
MKKMKMKLKFLMLLHHHLLPMLLRHLLKEDPIPTPHATPHASPTQEQPTETFESSIQLLNTLLKTCATLSQKVAELEQDKHTQALEIIKLKNRVKKLDKKKRSKSSGLKRLRKGRIDQDVSAATKDVSAAKPTVFDDEEVTMTMAQILNKMKAEKANILDEQIAQRKYQSLKKKPVSIAQARKNMIIYLKNMAGYKMEHFKGMTYENVRPIFEWEYKKVQTLFKPDKDVEEPQKKRVTEETLLQESFKKLKAVKVSGSDSTQETPSNDPKEMSEKDVQNMLQIRRSGCFMELSERKFSSAVPSVDKEKALWVELKRLFKPNTDDVLWKLQRERLSPVKWSHDPNEFRFCIDSKSSNKVSVLVVLDLSKVANPLYSLRDKDLSNSKDLVRNKQEKDKIRTKPNQIKKKREAWKSPTVSKTNHSQNIRKKKIQSPGTKSDKP